MVWGLRNEKGAVSTEEMGRAGSRFGEMGDQCLCRAMPLGCRSLELREKSAQEIKT